MRFPYYVVDTENGNVFGVEDEETAANCADSEGYFVIKAKTGEWLQYDGEFVDIVEGD